MITQPKLQVVHPGHASINASIVEGLRAANGVPTHRSEAPSGEVIGYFSQTSVEQIVRSVLQQLLASGATLPQSVSHQKEAAPILKNNPGLTPTDLGMTRRETEVLRILAQGKSNKEIGRELNIALGTVKVHVRTVCDKLNVTRRTEAIAAVNRMELVLTAS